MTNITVNVIETEIIKKFAGVLKKLVVSEKITDYCAMKDMDSVLE